MYKIGIITDLHNQIHPPHNPFYRRIRPCCIPRSHGNLCWQAQCYLRHILEVHHHKQGASTSCCTVARINTLQWRHSGRDGVSNHQPHDCLHNRLFRRRSKKTSKLRVTGLCEGNSPGFPAQRASNAENVSIWWHHHELRFFHWIKLILVFSMTDNHIHFIQCIRTLGFIQYIPHWIYIQRMHIVFLYATYAHGRFYSICICIRINSMYTPIESILLNILGWVWVWSNHHFDLCKADWPVDSTC